MPKDTRRLAIRDIPYHSSRIRLYRVLNPSAIPDTLYIMMPIGLLRCSDPPTVEPCYTTTSPCLGLLFLPPAFAFSFHLSLSPCGTSPVSLPAIGMLCLFSLFPLVFFRRARH
jgi:hypothetical protein